MTITFDRVLFATGGSLRINVPTPITKALNLKEKDQLTIWLNDGQIVMEKKKAKR